MQGTRPGGLTALAILNFVFGAYGALEAFGRFMLAAVVIADFRPPGAKGDFEHMKDLMREIGPGVLIGLGVAGIVITVLEIIAGVGYLKQKRRLGRGIGNAYALGSIGLTIATTLMMKTAETGGSLQLLTLVMAMYPALTLILLNTTFKEDFVR